jgi:hypothetical protein
MSFTGFKLALTATGVLLAVLVASLSLAPQSGAGVIGDLTSHYTTSKCAGTADHIDPINMVFKGTAGTPHHAANIITHHTDLDWQGGPSDESVPHDIGLNQRDAVRSSPNGSWSCVGPRWTSATWPDHCQLTVTGVVDVNSCPPHTRYHIRYWKIPYAKSNGVTFTVGDAHHEDGTHNVFSGNVCHAVNQNGPGGSGFDNGRGYIVNGVSGPLYPTQYVNWGNTQTMKQCDGGWAGSDGAVAFINIGHSDND